MVENSEAYFQKREEIIKLAKEENARLTKEEKEQLKADLLTFIHKITTGEFSSPEYLSSLVPVFQCITNYF